MSTFAELGLPEPFTEMLARRGITSPFPIQAMTIPDVLAGRDVAGRAPTGSGKTLAFGLPALARLERGRSRRPRGLILSPTRELADQILTELQPLAKAVGRSMVAVYGGVSYGPQRSRLQQGIDLLVACPGRLEDLIDQGVVDLRDVDLVVVDEADRMADMGFLPAVKRILDMTSSERQTILFSATLDGDVAVLTQRYQRDPVRHESDLQDDDTANAEHHFWKVERADRTAHVARVVSSASPTIVFTRTRHGADRLAKQLAGAGVNAVALHGGRSQQQRNRALKDFASGRSQALVATDVAATGHSRRRRCQRGPLRPARGREDLCAPFGADRPCRRQRNGGLTCRREPGQECPEDATVFGPRLRNGDGTRSTHAQGASSPPRRDLSIHAHPATASRSTWATFRSASPGRTWNGSSPNTEGSTRPQSSPIGTPGSHVVSASWR